MIIFVPDWFVGVMVIFIVSTTILQSIEFYQRWRLRRLRRLLASVPEWGMPNEVVERLHQ